MERKEVSVLEQKKLNYPKEKLLHIMSEVLLDSVDYLIQYSNTCKELQKKGVDKAADEIDELSEKLHNSLLELEQNVCMLRGVDLEKYYEDVTQYDVKGDKEVKGKLDVLGKLIETALKGDKIVVDFEVAPELTKAKTLNLYRLILTSHLHLHCTSIQKYLKEHQTASPEELQAVVDNDDDEKVKRRDSLMVREKVSRRPEQDYRMVLHSAYYTYLTHDSEFEKQIQKILKLYNSILGMLLEGKQIPELKLDPLTMNPILFEEFYNRLNTKYLHGMAMASLIQTISSND